jgi:hypothetical protein
MSSLLQKFNNQNWWFGCLVVWWFGTPFPFGEGRGEATIVQWRISVLFSKRVNAGVL